MVSLFFLFILGLAVGSFLNLVIDRTPRDQSILKPGSACDQCGHPLRATDLIPVLSYFLLKRRCRYCHTPLSWRLPVVELWTGALFILVGLFSPPSLPLPLALLTVSLLFGIGVSDLIFGLIPDVLIFPGVLILGFWSLVFGHWPRLLLTLSLVVFFGLFYLVTRGKGLGFGDVKLAALLGLILDPFLGILALDLGLVIGGIVGLALIATKRKKFGETVPLGTFLVLGMLITFIFSDWIVDKIKI